MKTDAQSPRRDVLHNVVVLPQSELNGFHRPLSGGLWKFGPAGSRLPESAFHTRRGRCLSDREFLTTHFDNHDLIRIPGRWLYAGPFDWHFGHFISECLGRLWAIENESDIDGVVFCPTFHSRRGGFNWTSELPQWQLEVLRLTKCNLKTIYFVKEPVVFEELVVVEQGTSLGNLPERYYLDWVGRNYLEYLSQCPIHLEVSKKLFVSRAGLVTEGGFKMRNRLGAYLESMGFREFFPERHSLRVQLTTLDQQDLIVFESGSAVHLVELLPRLGAKVFVLPRWRDNQKDWIPIFTGRDITYELSRTSTSFIGSERRKRAVTVVDIDFLIGELDLWLKDSKRPDIESR